MKRKGSESGKKGWRWNKRSNLKLDEVRGRKKKCGKKEKSGMRGKGLEKGGKYVLLQMLEQVVCVRIRIFSIFWPKDK